MILEADKDFLTVVLNEALLNGKSAITLRSDLLDLGMIGVDLERSEFQFIVGQQDYDSAMAKMASGLSEYLAKDLPDFLDFREALQSSLLLPPDNLPELMSEIYSIEERKKDPYRYPRKKCFALDTNILYKRLFSRLLMVESGCGVRDFDANDVQLLIPSLAEEELSRRVRKKYSKEEVEQYKRVLRNGPLTDMMFNCLHKNGRKAMNGQTELAILKERYNYWPVQGGEFSEDKEERDQIMLVAIADTAYSQRMDVLFLTNDDKSRAHANAVKVESMLLRYPYEVPSILAYDPWLFAELLYDLSTQHLSVSIMGTGVRVIGDWSGKSVNDYHDQRIRLDIDRSSRFAGVIQRDLAIITQIKKGYPWKDIR